MELLDRNNPRPTVIPNVRTREGIRLRWFDEHPSNQINSGSCSGTAAFRGGVARQLEPARVLRRALALGKHRAAPCPSGPAAAVVFRCLHPRSVRSGGELDEQTPVLSGGRYHGNPFGPPQEGSGRYVLFDVPRSETGVISLGQLQHAKLSEFIWHPSYAIGNSLADPRLGTGGPGPHRTAALAASSTAAKSGGFHENQIGWSSDTQRGQEPDEWAATARAMLGDVPDTDNLVYDLSFEANHALWDRYFLSTGTSADEATFHRKIPSSTRCPTRRMKPRVRAATTVEQLDDFHQSRRHLMVDGAFNVNSTRVEAWKALLGPPADRIRLRQNTPFPRVLDAAGRRVEKRRSAVE